MYVAVCYTNSNNLNKPDVTALGHGPVYIIDMPMGALCDVSSGALVWHSELQAVGASTHASESAGDDAIMGYSFPVPSSSSSFTELPEAPILTPKADELF
jgi:hypothetical protein